MSSWFNFDLLHFICAQIFTDIFSVYCGVFLLNKLVDNRLQEMLVDHLSRYFVNSMLLTDVNID